MRSQTSMKARVRRACALSLLAVTTVVTIGMASAPAQAMPPGDVWYRCYVPDYGWMYCLDV
ncbi:hypothetical protein ACFOY2_42500 [Nonomuraea purpurea]|uniref:Secreted protein n=1 Tax=Nonomuraea purpurea TaxID=1849276 RepID=A0ABV8GMS5_9ACTN